MRLKCRRLSTATEDPNSRIQDLDEIDDDIEVTQITNSLFFNVKSLKIEINK